MKKRTLLAMILSLVMCLGIAMPTWAAEEIFTNQYSIGQDLQVNAEVGIDNISIINDITFEPAEISSLEVVDDDYNLLLPNEKNGQNDDEIHYIATFDKGTVDVYTTVNNITTTEITNFVNMANNAIKQEMAIISAKDETVPDFILYQYTDGHIQISCGADTANTRNNANVDDFYVTQVDIFENIALDNNEELSVNDIVSTQSTAPEGFEQGMGIRQFANEDGQYLTAIITNCPPLNVDKMVNGVANSSYGYYHYVGFKGRYNNKDLVTDMGLLYSPGYKGWQPYLKVNQNDKVYMLYSADPRVENVGYVKDELGQKAAYGMTSPITITAYKTVPSYNNNNISKIRLTVKGTRINPREENIMCISEAGTGVNVTVKWKVLTTITGSKNFPAASNSSAPRIEMNYSGVKIGTKTATWSTKSDEITEYHARITHKDDGEIQGKVNFS